MDAEIEKRKKEAPSSLLKPNTTKAKEDKDKDDVKIEEDENLLTNIGGNG